MCFVSSFFLYSIAKFYIVIITLSFDNNNKILKTGLIFYYLCITQKKKFAINCFKKYFLNTKIKKKYL